MTSLLLKIIAIIAMFCDHLSYALPQRVVLLNAIGRIAFPIFAFSIAQGYIHTRSLKRYFIRLVIFAVVSQLPFMLLMKMAGAGFRLNIFVTLILGLSAIMVYDKVQPRLLGIALSLIIALLGDIFYTDYGAWGVLLILFMYVLTEYKNAGGDARYTRCLSQACSRLWCFICIPSH